MQTHFNQIEKLISRLGASKGISTVFNDILDLAIYPLIAKDNASLARNPLDNYKAEEQKDLVEILKIIGVSMAGYTDGLGDFFMQYLSFGKNGQFFTPQPICDMMAQMLYSGQENPENYTPSVCDCACGSGRTLLAAAKINRNQLFYGSDIDLTCVKMTVINMAYNSLQGDIHWLDSIAMKHYATFAIRIEPLTKLPFVITYKANESKSVEHIKKVAANMPDHQKQQVKAQQMKMF